MAFGPLRVWLLFSSLPWGHLLWPPGLSPHPSSCPLGLAPPSLPVALLVVPRPWEYGGLRGEERPGHERVCLVSHWGAVSPVPPFLCQWALQHWNWRAQGPPSDLSGSDTIWASVGFTVLRPSAPRASGHREKVKSPGTNEGGWADALQGPSGTRMSAGVLSEETGMCVTHLGTILIQKCSNHWQKAISRKIPTWTRPCSLTTSDA